MKRGREVKRARICAAAGLVCGVLTVADGFAAEAPTVAKATAAAPAAGAQRTAVADALRDFQDRRFGMFIHWGAYSRLGGRYKGRDVGPDIGEWIMNCLQIPIAEYEEIARAFDPVEFDADAVAGLAARAGMRYVVLTAKHHDGFAMFRSKADRYNVADWTGTGRDVTAELAAACRRHGLRFGVYYSQALDWHEPDAGGWDVRPGGMRPAWGNVWDFPDNSTKVFDRYFRKKVIPQVTELLTGYGALFLIWFDTPRTISAAESEELYQLVKSHQPECLVNSRIGNGKGDYGSLGDNQVPASAMETPQETPVTLNDTWGFKHDDANWKSKEEIVELLVKVASRGVNLLLNIGPRGDGSLTPETVSVLRGVGEWTAINGEAVHGTRANPTPGGFDWGYLTMGPRKVYLCLKEDRARTLRLNGLLGRVDRVRFLGEASDLAFTQTVSPDGARRTLAIEIPKTGRFMPVVAVECAGSPAFQPGLQVQDDSLVLHPLAATLFDGRVKEARSVLAPRVYEEAERKAAEAALGRLRLDSAGLLTGWRQASDWIEWTAVFHERGVYRVEWVALAPDSPKTKVYAGDLVLKAGDARPVVSPLRADAAYSESRTTHGNRREITRAGTITIDAPGARTLRLQLGRNLRVGEAEPALAEVRLVRGP
jgi:alpha-L-fucosidase